MYWLEYWLCYVQCDAPIWDKLPDHTACHAYVGGYLVNSVHCGPLAGFGQCRVEHHCVELFRDGRIACNGGICWFHLVVLTFNCPNCTFCSSSGWCRECIKFGCWRHRQLTTTCISNFCYFCKWLSVRHCQIFFEANDHSATVQHFRNNVKQPGAAELLSKTGSK